MSCACFISPPSSPLIQFWACSLQFELKNGFVSKARKVYERSVEFFGDDHLYESLYVAYARFEEQHKEYDRARAIYKYALDKIPKVCSRASAVLSSASAY
jgi:crooked neck